MTKKRFTTKDDIICSSYCIWDNNDKPYGKNEVIDLLNNYAEENEYLKSVINEICTNIKERPTMTKTEILVKLMNMLDKVD